RLMKVIGTGLCLFLIIPVGGRLNEAEPLARSNVLAPGRLDPAVQVAALKERARVALRAGRYDEAEELCSYGYRASREAGDTEAAVQFQVGVANCALASYHHRQALESFLTAKSLLRELGKQSGSASVEIGLSSVYTQLGEYDAALVAAREGLQRKL